MQKPYTKAKTNNLKKDKRNLIKLLDSCNKLNIKYIIIPLVDNSKLNSIKEENETVNFFKF